MRPEYRSTDELNCQIARQLSDKWEAEAGTVTGLVDETGVQPDRQVVLIDLDHHFCDSRQAAALVLQEASADKVVVHSAIIEDVHVAALRAGGIDFYESVGKALAAIYHKPYPTEDSASRPPVIISILITLPSYQLDLPL